MQNLQPLKETISKTTYQEQVYNMLEKMIVSGNLQPGQKLVEAELAASLGVSRSPVREAIIHLEQEGLVRNTKKGGWVVSEISLQDIMELYDLRKLIEVHAGGVGCLNCPQEIRDEMEVIGKEFEAIDEKIELWREKNRRYHELIVLSCGNKKIHDVFLRTLKGLRWCTYLALGVTGRRAQAILEHKKILRGFLRQDKELVEEAVGEHIETVQNIIKKNFGSKGINMGDILQKAIGS